MFRWLQKLIAAPKKSKAKIVKILRINSKPNSNTTTDELYEYLTGKKEETTSIGEGIHKGKNKAVTIGQTESS